MVITNLYLVPNHKNPKGGRFYNIYKNQGVKLDLSGLIDLDDIDRLEEDVHEATGDETFKRIGGVITSLDEQIESTNIYNEFSSGETISPEQKRDYEQLLRNMAKISEIEEHNRQLLVKLRTSMEKRKVKTLKRGPRHED